MIVDRIQLGEKHKDVRLVKFGTGDILLHQLENDVRVCLAFAQTEKPGKIGEVSNEYNGKTSDDFKEEVKVLFEFDKPESITALVHSLIELQERLFRKQEKLEHLADEALAEHEQGKTSPMDDILLPKKVVEMSPEQRKEFIDRLNNEINKPLKNGKNTEN